MPVASAGPDDGRFHRPLRPACTVEPVGVVEVRVGDGGHGILVVGDRIPELWVDLPGGATSRGFRRFDRATIRLLRSGLTSRVGGEVLQMRLATSLRRRNRSLVVDVGSRRLELVPRGIPGAGRSRVRRVGERGELARFSPGKITVDAAAAPAEIAVAVFLAAMEAQRLVAVPITPVVGHHIGEFFAEGAGQVIVDGLIRLAVEAFAALLDGL
ncbi:MAG TPA: hypothetical protein VFN21_05955 [Acidimicrobiales bacterium]|nr:hypothetical protein [Acidimicrobiales bacterium]